MCKHNLLGLPLYIINFDRSLLEPAACKLYMAFELNTAGQKPTVHVPSAHCQKLYMHKDIRQMLKNMILSAKIFARVAGQCFAMMRAWPLEINVTKCVSAVPASSPPPPLARPLSDIKMAMRLWSNRLTPWKL